MIAGWKTNGSIATNTDPVLGGIVDCNIATGKWFIIFNADIPTIEGLNSRDEAFEKHYETISEHYYIA